MTLRPKGNKAARIAAAKKRRKQQSRPRPRGGESFGKTGRAPKKHQKKGKPTISTDGELGGWSTKLHTAIDNTTGKEITPKMKEEHIRREILKEIRKTDNDIDLSEVDIEMKTADETMIIKVTWHDDYDEGDIAGPVSTAIDNSIRDNPQIKELFGFESAMPGNQRYYHGQDNEDSQFARWELTNPVFRYSDAEIAALKEEFPEMFDNDYTGTPHVTDE